MTTFEDGPAHKKPLLLQRSPLFLRVTESPDGKWDGLDQVEDTPNPEETLHAYRRDIVAGMVHLYFGGGKGGWYRMVSYRFVDPQPPDEDMRTNERWQAWCTRSSKT